MTCAIVHINNQGKAWICTAGHPPVLLWRAAQQKIDAFFTPGLPLGIMDPSPLAYQVRETELHDGDRLFLYTDGLLELSDSQGEEWGMVRLEQFIHRHASSPINDLSALLQAELERVLGARQQEDDITMLALEFHPPA